MPNVAKIAQRAEQAGFYEAVLGDHIIFPNEIRSSYPYAESGVHHGSMEGETLECLSLLTFIAAKTSVLRIVTGIMIVPNRNPIIAAKQLSTIDVLSEGRLSVGVGVGWMKEEFKNLGLIAFEERGKVTDEYIRAYIELWTKDNPRFEGNYCSFSDIRFLPKPIQRPYPPIWIGGESDAALKRVARIGNCWHPIGLNRNVPLETPNQLKNRIDKLNEFVLKEGRDPSDIEIAYRIPHFQLRNTNSPKPFVGTQEQILSNISAFANIGVSHLIFDFRSYNLDETLALIDEFADKIAPYFLT
jgi:probable F420-dependent oxidoreductase